MTATTLYLRPAPHVSVHAAQKPGLRGSTRRWEVALVLVLLCISGNRAALRLAGPEITYAVAAALLAGALLLCRGGQAVRAFVPVGAVFAALSIIHAYAFDFFPIITVVGFLTRLFIGMAVVIVVSNFAHTYVVTMVGLSLLSFVFWLPEYIASQLGIHFHNLFAALATRLGPQTVNDWSLGFHTYMIQAKEAHRNAGIFWEPGAFSGYLIIALVMLAAIRPSLTRKQHVIALGILTVALFTTFSTAGYIAYPITLLLNYDWRGVNRGGRIRVVLGICVVAPIVIVGSFFAFDKLDFLRAKISRQISAVERHERGWRKARMGTLMFDWEYISKRPLTGWGINQRTRFSLTPWARDDSNKMGNGMSAFIVYFGVIGFGRFVLALGRGASHIGGKSLGYILGFIASTLLVLQGEPYLNFPLFLGLMFLGHASVGGQRLPRFRRINPGSAVPVRCLRATEL